MPTAPFILRFTNAYGEWFYFQNLGALWPHDPRKHFIERTTPHKGEARTFATPEEANEIVVKAGSPSGWEVMDADGKII